MSEPGDASDSDDINEASDVEPELEQDEQTGGRGKLVLLAVAIAAVIAVGIGAIVVAQGSDSDDTTETDTAEANENDGDPPDPPATDEVPDDVDPATEDDAPEGESGEDQPDGAAPAEPDEPVETAAGSFVSLDYEVSGDVKLLEQPGGNHVVRLEDLASDDGPDLYVYLSTNPSDGPADAFKADFADLGPLQDLTGTQDYEVPAEVDPSQFASVVIWCEEVSAPFGAADLSG